MFRDGLICEDKDHLKIIFSAYFPASSTQSSISAQPTDSVLLLKSVAIKVVVIGLVLVVVVVMVVVEGDTLEGAQTGKLSKYETWKGMARSV